MAEDVARSYRLEVTRGMTFYFVGFNENTFEASHMHCLSDSTTISEMPEDENEGYVTSLKLQGQDGKEGRQYLWVCKDCFTRLKSAMEWRVGEYFSPGPAAVSSWARRVEKRSQAQLTELIRNHPYALVSWGPEEVVGIAAGRGFEISTARAEEILRNNERKIEGAMTAAGFAKLVEILGAAGLPTRPT